MATAELSEVARFQDKFQSLKAEVAKVLVGQETMLHKLLLGFLAGGHVLLEGVPGLAKTLAVRTVASSVSAAFSRIQFTPDMLPGDVTGTQIFNPREGSYSIKKGPIFANLILADEINRAPAILDRMAGASLEPRVTAVLEPADILAGREAARQVFVDDKVKRYAVDLVGATRDPAGAGLPQLKNLIENGASVRASINLIKLAKANALLAGRTYISPHDVKSIAHDVLRHRVLVTYEAEAQGKTADDLIEAILDNVEVP